MGKRSKLKISTIHDGIESRLRFGHIDHKDISTPRLRDMAAKCELLDQFILVHNEIDVVPVVEV